MKHTFKLFVLVPFLALSASAGYAQKQQPLGDALSPVAGGITGGGGIVTNKPKSIAGKASISLAMQEPAFLVSGQLIVLGINPTQNNQSPASVTAPPQQVQATIYPNPTTGTINILLEDGIRSIDRVTVMDQTSRLVSDVTTEVSIDGNSLRFSVGNLASGAYFVRVNSRGKSWVYKLVIEH